jgi:hypothetical protein
MQRIAEMTHQEAMAVADAKISAKLKIQAEAQREYKRLQAHVIKRLVEITDRDVASAVQLGQEPAIARDNAARRAEFMSQAIVTWIDWSVRG